jgi:hypothetical protein
MMMQRRCLQHVLQHPIGRRTFLSVSFAQDPIGFVTTLAATMAVGRVALYVGGGVLAYRLWRSESENGIVEGMCSVLEAGGAKGWDSTYVNDATALVPRPAVEAQLLATLRPAARLEQYAAVYGASGTGKSTSVRKLVRSSKGGLLYSELTGDFSLDLARAVGYRSPIDILGRLRRLVNGESADPLHALGHMQRWYPLSRMIRKAASLYTERHGRAPTLVLDAMDQLAESEPAYFSLVLDFAKACADTGVLRVVLVFSQGSALPLLQASPALSRCGPICEVGDIGDAEAEAHLVACYQRTPEQAAELVATVTGGRFPLLQACGASPRPLADIGQELDDSTLASLKRVGVPLTHPLLRALLAKGALSTSSALALMPAAQVEELLRCNVLAVHPSRTYTLSSRRVQGLVRKAL